MTDGGFYTAGEAAQLTHVPRSTVHYWVRTGLVEPSVSLARPMLFSFLDLRDLVVINRLRGQLPTQTIRRAVDWLRTVADVQHIVHAECRQRDGEIVWIPTGDPHSEVLASRGGQIFLTLDEVWNELDAEVRDGEIIALHPAEHVDIDPDVRGGTPVVSGTRTPTALVAELIDGGLSPEEIVAMYPLLTVEAVAAVHKWEQRRHVSAA